MCIRDRKKPIEKPKFNLKGWYDSPAHFEEKIVKTVDDKAIRGWWSDTPEKSKTKNEKKKKIQTPSSPPWQFKLPGFENDHENFDAEKEKENSKSIVQGILYELLAKLPPVEESEKNVESWPVTPKRPKNKKKNLAKSPAWQFKIPGFENDDLNENFENDNVEKTGQNLDVEDSNEKVESMIRGILNEMVSKLPLLELSLIHI